MLPTREGGLVTVVLTAGNANKREVSSSRIDYERRVQCECPAVGDLRRADTSTGANAVNRDVDAARTAHRDALEASPRCTKVLVVDDFEPARFVRATVLERAGFDVVEASSANEARASAAIEIPDIALLDVDLPDEDGFQLCASLKRTYPTLPVLLISAVHLAAWTRDLGVDVGASGYLRDPVDAFTLVGRVRLALSGVTDAPSLNWIMTDIFGAILQASVPAARMLYVNEFRIRGRSLLPFFTRNRHEWAAALHLAASGALVQKTGVIRPKERRQIDVAVEIARVREWNPSSPTLIWTFSELHDPLRP
jgi:DNA-binding response OmpR family regulator